MDTGGLAQMTYNNNFSSGGFNPSNGFASRGKGSNPKRLSVALPPKVNSIHENQVDSPLPRATSRSHLLAGLRKAPRGNNQPASAPYSQSYHQLPTPSSAQWADAGYDTYNQGYPQTAQGFGMSQYMNDSQQAYSMPEQVLAPPTLFGQEDELDPQMLEQLQLTGMFLAQRQQQLQQQLANITAAANQLQGMGMYQQQPYGQQQMQSPIEVPGQPGVYLVYDAATGQYQYATQNVAQPQAPPRKPSPLAQSQSMYNFGAAQSAYDAVPTFRAEISPPPVDKPVPANLRSITPPKKSDSPQAGSAFVEPLPPPSANAFRRGHQKKVSSISISKTGTSEGPKTASAATFGSARSVMPPAPMTGTFGPGAARAGEHPLRQPRGPPALEELVALPTANHEGSKNFAARRRRCALKSLVRAGSVRRGVSGSSAGSPVSESGLSIHSSEMDAPGLYRKQSPIGSERSANRGSQSSLEGLGTGSAVQTPVTEDGNAFDMSSFIKQLPSHVQQGQERKRMMIGVLSAAEKRKSFQY